MVSGGKKIRIGYAAFSHESNSFAYQIASLDKWKERGLLYGEDIRAEYESSKASIAGYYGRYRDEVDVELVPLIFARIMPMGPITKEATEFLFSEILRLIAEQGPWDGLLLPLHGAAVSDKYLDADGEISAQIRDLVGDDVVIGASLDMHANVSQKIVEECDVVTIYLPRIPEIFFAMLACAKIGAVHSVVFAGYSSEALNARIDGSESKVVITVDGSWINGKVFPMKQIVDEP